MSAGRVDPVERKKRLYLFFGAVVLTPALFGCWYVSALLGGAPAARALTVSATFAAIFVAGMGIYAWLLWSGYYLPQSALRWLTCYFVLACTANTALSLNGLFGLRGVPILTGIGAVSGAVFGFYVLRSMRAQIPKQVRWPVDLRSLTQADEAIRFFRGELASGELDPWARVTLETNLASALVRRSVLTDRADGLVEASRLVEHAVRRRDVDPPAAFNAARCLVDAIYTRYRKHGEGGDYRRAIELLRTAASRLPEPAQVANLLGIEEGNYAHYELIQAEAAGDAAAADLWRERALTAYQGVADANRRRSQFRSLAFRHIANLLLASEVPLDPDRVVEMCREARRGRRTAGPQGDLLLCEALLNRASEGSSVTADLRRAERLARHAYRRSGPDPVLRAEAAEWVAVVLDVREMVSGRSSGSVGAAYRRALADARRVSVGSGTGVARSWAQWAIEKGDVDEAAEAMWQIVTGLPAELRRRYHRSAREQYAAGTQGTAAEAGYWLLMAGRVRDAVTAIEYARAILLTDAVHEDPPDLDNLLLGRGRPDLLDRRRAARLRLDSADRRQYVTDPRPAAGTVVSEQQHAWSEWDAVNREIAAVVGIAAVYGEQIPSFGELRATADEPLVYLVAAERTGYALIVRRAAAAPVPVRLPGLTADVVRRESEDFVTWLAAGSAESTSPVEPLLRWLWAMALAPVAAVLPAGSVPAVIPVGALSLLPLHAAALAHDGVPRAFSYAPNARLLARSRRIAAGAPRRPSVLAADVPRAPGLSPIPFTARETTRLHVLYGKRSRLLPNASSAQVLAAMRDADVWHFATHGRADLDEPLDSALVLSDRALTVREIMAVPGSRHRLAVLSACTTNLPDRRLLDEVVSFPGAFLRAGVAAVVSAQWTVDDVAAGLLLTRFHQLWSGTRPPAVALVEAQQWLRTATNAELRRLVPDLIAPAVALTAEHLALWEGLRPFADPWFWAAFSCTGA